MFVSGFRVYWRFKGGRKGFAISVRFGVSSFLSGALPLR